MSVLWLAYRAQRNDFPLCPRGHALQKSFPVKGVIMFHRAVHRTLPVHGRSARSFPRRGYCEQRRGGHAGRRYLSETPMLIISNIYPEAGLLDAMVVLF